MHESYQVLTDSILNNSTNWGADMKYLIPSMSNFLIAIICKYPDLAKTFSASILNVIKSLISTDVRMETQSLAIGSTVFEKLGIPNEEFLKNYLFSIFSTLHFYKNNTKSKAIPIMIMSAVWQFFANFMINNGVIPLLATCNSIQPGLIFQILKSEGEKIKYIKTPLRERKYAIVAYSQLIQETISDIPDESLAVVIKALAELCYSQQAT